MPDVRFGSQADICTAIGHVRYTPESDIKCVFSDVCARLHPRVQASILVAQSGRRPCNGHGSGRIIGLAQQSSV